MEKPAPQKNAEAVTLEELFAPDERDTPTRKTMLSRARRGAVRLAHRPPYSGPQRETKTAADLQKFRVEIGAKDLVRFVDIATGEVYEPPQVGDSVVAVMAERMERFGFKLQVEYINATKKRVQL